MLNPASERLHPKSTALEGVLSVEACSAHAFSRHTHDEFGIGVMLEGAQDSASGRGLVRAEAGQVITVNPGEVHDGTPVGGAPRHWRMLYFTPAALAEVFEGHELPPGTELAHPVLNSPPAARAVLLLHCAVSSLSAPALVIDGLLMEAVSYLVDHPRNLLAAVPSAVAPARRTIDDAPEQVARLDELAALCGLSRFQFLRTFKAATGLPPHAYQVQRRLQLARRLILEGTGPAEAAVAAGFTDQSHLHRHFLRAYGYTPGRLARA